MNMIPGRDVAVLMEAVARAERRLGILRAVSVIRPPLLSQDAATALGLLDALEEEAAGHAVSEHASPSAPPCTRVEPGRLGCLAALADGWINAGDLCAGCTSRFMRALDQAAGEPLTWHANYVKRAAQ